ncbi:hypothetical protein H2204_011503 [Knufia peltigerae]|uniref:Uncharacterized protein n=1 Tax=Knufia peltigerae TaxID=1002370 RepID=A0AA39CTX4_9EURO|nr:hypothetical protein H2204_011503 [Knufia peltigerae]
MEQALKARTMTAASVRQRNTQQRLQLNALEQEGPTKNNRQNTRYKLSLTNDLEDSEASSADDMATDRERFERESSVETPSECSVLTPDEPRQDRATFGRPSIYEPSTDTPLKLEIPEHEDVMQIAMEGTRIVVPPSPQPVLEASLASWSDFRYDRYSMVLSSSPVSSEVHTPDPEGDETFSPIETATPVSYRQPRARPSLISIVSSPHRGKRRNTSAQSPLSQEVFQPPKRPARRTSSSSSLNGYPAAEATLFEIPDLPANAIEMIASASQDSLLLPSFPSNEVKAPSLRKSSVPRLPSALNHSRVSSIKTLIKTPTSATHARAISGASSHYSRPSTASMSGVVEATPALKKLASAGTISRASAMLRRPSTAMSTSSTDSHSHGVITALPSVPRSTAADEDDNNPDNTRSMQRKKSFSNLRRRSESIHQAIKGFGKISTKQQDIPVMPSLSTPYHPDLSGSPAPPLPSPRTTGKSSGVRTPSFMSTFSRGSNGGGIGLGLRNI